MSRRRAERGAGSAAKLSVQVPAAPLRESRHRLTAANVQVSLRLRPTLPLDQGHDQCEEVLLHKDEPGRCSYRGTCFRFRHTFGPDSTTSEIFAAHRESICRVLKGYDCTLLVYGQTGSGKTHTMMGEPGRSQGLVPLAVDMLFEQIYDRRDGATFSLQLSVLEAPPPMPYSAMQSSTIRRDGATLRYTKLW